MHCELILYISLSITHMPLPPMLWGYIEAMGNSNIMVRVSHRAYTIVVAWAYG